MTITELVFLLTAVIVIAVGGAFGIGYYCGKEDTAAPRKWEKDPASYPYREHVNDAYDRFLEICVDGEYGTVRPGADTGEIAALYGSDYPEWISE